MRAMRIPVVPEAVGGEEGLGEAGGGVLEVGAGASFDELVQRELVARTVLPVVEAAWASGGADIAKSVRTGSTGMSFLVSSRLWLTGFLPQIMEALPKDMPPALRRRLEGENVGHV